MLLGTDELTILRGSKFYGTWQWINSVTGDPEDFAGLTASVKIKNIHEDFEDVRNTYEVGTATVEPLDINQNAFKGRVDIELSKEDTLLFGIPESEDDRYGESDFYAILEILLSTGEVILQAKVKVIESLESETANFLTDNRSEAIIINGKLDNILAKEDEILEAIDILPILNELQETANEIIVSKQEIDSIRTAIEVMLDNFDDRYLGEKTSDPLVDNDGNPLNVSAIYYNIPAKELKFYNGVSWDSPVAAAQTYALQASQSAGNAQTFKNQAEGFKNTASTKADEASASASSALASKNASKISEDNAKNSEDLALENANKILNLTVSIETLAPGQSATSSYNATTGILTIGIPQGVKGDSGLSAYQVAVNNGFVGTESQWLVSLKGTSITIDSTISSGSNNAISSGAVFTAIGDINSALDAINGEVI